MGLSGETPPTGKRLLAIELKNVWRYIFLGGEGGKAKSFLGGGKEKGMDEGREASVKNTDNKIIIIH